MILLQKEVYFYDVHKIFLSYLHSVCRLIECSYNHSDEEEEYA